jgi:hypothetical protein
VIIVHDKPRILSQTQRRRRYPKRQQRHCYDCFQPMHWKQKYSAPLEIFKQFLKAINAPLRSAAEFPNFCIKQERGEFSLHVATALVVRFFGERAVEFSPDPISSTLNTSS